MFNSLMGKYSGPGLSSEVLPFAAIGGGGYTKGPSSANITISSITGGQRVVSPVSPGGNGSYWQTAAFRLAGLPTFGPVYFEQVGSGHDGGPDNYPYFRLGLAVNMVETESTFGATSAGYAVAGNTPGFLGLAFQPDIGLGAQSGGSAMSVGSTEFEPENGDRLGWAVDMDAGHVWLQIGDDVWQDGLSPNDAPWATFPTGRVVGPMCSVVGDGVSRQATVDTYYESSGLLWEPTSYFK
jgi:hypothetical protein